MFIEQAVYKIAQNTYHKIPCASFCKPENHLFTHLTYLSYVLYLSPKYLTIKFISFINLTVPFCL